MELLGRVLGLGMLAGVCNLLAGSPARADDLLWQLGTPDDSPAEFSVYKKLEHDTLVIPSDWKTRTDWKLLPKGMRGNVNPVVNLAFDLRGVPANGVMFSFKLLQAPKSGPQLAVFANGAMAGLIQMWGTAETDSPYHWQKTYRLYIPKELLVAGQNTLRLEATRPMWSDSTVDDKLWWEWDFLKMESLSSPAVEPVHGTVAYLGTTLHSGGMFKVDEDTVRMAAVALPWLGIAYSGNIIRADFWYDVVSHQPRRLEYLKQLCALNMTVCADNISGSHFKLDADGQMPAKIKQGIDNFFQQYGQYIQYFELGNEPCMFGGGYAEYLAQAQYMSKNKPAHLKVAAAGWAFGGGKGTPINWDAEAVLRGKIEAYCQVLNGHSYGYSYADNRGGSFVENLKTYKGVEDGWPKESITTETGTTSWHSEENGPRFASSQPHAQAFDRILRAHLAVVDRTMQHAAVFDDYGLFQPQLSWADPATAAACPGVNREDTRLKTFRRLALAYATHGAPLPYTIANLNELAGRKVYFRAVDTAALPGQAGSQATANKLLLNFVNFEPTPQMLKVRVTLPQAGAYVAERFGAADTYGAAHSTVTLRADPALELSEQLEAGEAVQYILTPPGPVAPYSPAGLAITPDDGQAQLTWRACAGATGYELKRSTMAGPLVSIANHVAGTSYTDGGLSNGTTYLYVISAANSAGQSGAGASVSVVVGSPLPPDALTAQSGDSQVALTWSASPRAKSYRIQRSEGRTGSYQEIGQTSGLQYQDKKCANDRVYRYVVTAINAAGESEVSAVAVGTPEAPPPAPAELSTIAGDQRVVVRWKAVPGVSVYNVKRSETAGGPAQIVAGDVAGTVYLDNAVSNGKSYDYVVSAIKLGPEGADSVKASALPTAEPMPAPWQQQDIGTVGRKGSATYVSATGVFTVQAAGADIWGPADGLHFVYQPLVGDGTMVAHITSFDNTHNAARFGLAIRQTLEPGAVMACAAASPSSASLTTRAVTGGICQHQGGPFRPWIKLSRKSDTISAFLSEDGQKWQPLATEKLAVGEKAFIGLVVCSHNPGVLNKTMFDHVTWSP
jgi:hypothetical protein